MEAFVTPDEVLSGFKEPRKFFFHDIYNKAPPEARYMVGWRRETLIVIDIYGSPIQPMGNGNYNLIVKPLFVCRPFANVEHAIASLRILYDNT